MLDRFTYYSTQKYPEETRKRGGSYCVYDNKIFLRKAQLGKGSSGEVYALEMEKKQEGEEKKENAEKKETVTFVVKKELPNTEETPKPLFSHGADMAAEAAINKALYGVGAFSGDRQEVKHPHYILMKRANGTLLENYTPSSLMEFLKLYMAILKAYEQLHKDHKILHIDIKSTNIFVDFRDGQYRISIIDFNCSRSIGEMTSFDINETDHIAPELAKQTVTAPSQDVYSLGWTLKYLRRQQWFKTFSCFPFVLEWIKEIEVKMMEKDASKRFSLVEAIHAFEALDQCYEMCLSSQVEKEEKKAEKKEVNNTISYYLGLLPWKNRSTFISYLNDSMLKNLIKSGNDLDKALDLLSFSPTSGELFFQRLGGDRYLDYLAEKIQRSADTLFPSLLGRVMRILHEQKYESLLEKIEISRLKNGTHVSYVLDYLSAAKRTFFISRLTKNIIHKEKYCFKQAMLLLDKYQSIPEFFIMLVVSNQTYYEHRLEGPPYTGIFNSGYSKDQKVKASKALHSALQEKKCDILSLFKTHPALQSGELGEVAGRAIKYVKTLTV